MTMLVLPADPTLNRPHRDSLRRPSDDRESRLAGQLSPRASRRRGSRLGSAR